MKIAVTGGTGLVGRFFVEDALAHGDRVVVLSRRAPRQGFFSAPVMHQAFDLSGAAPDLDGVDLVVHCAFDHLPGRYRGGEGDDPEGFLRDNVDGSRRLIEAAQSAGVSAAVFLSSRAIYGDYPPGTVLEETTEPRPDTLYGQAKLEVERMLSGLDRPDFRALSLRATGVYGPAGPGVRHKWTSLFEAFLRGETCAPRVATEVHGADLAAAMRCLLGQTSTDGQGPVYNVSDILLDRRDLLFELGRLTGVAGALPDRANAGRVSPMATNRLRSFGWTPGGMDALRRSLPAMLE